MNKKLLGRSFIHAFLAFAYIFGIALFLNIGAKNLFGSMPEFLAPVIILLLLVLSAAIMSILVFGKPVLMYFDNQKKDALSLLFLTVGWLALILFMTIFLVIIIK